MTDVTKSYFKSMNTDVVKEVGKSGALLLTQLYQWVKTKNVNKVFRTNLELVEDLCGLLSSATIQRAKRKLIEYGFIELSFDKGIKRTTHYTLTEKALAFLTGNKFQTTDAANTYSGSKISGFSSVKEEVVQTPVEVFEVSKSYVLEANTNSVNVQVEPTVKPKQDWIPKHLYAQHMKDKKKQDYLNKEMVISEDMKKSFDEGMTGNKNATKGIPEEALVLLPAFMRKKIKR